MKKEARERESASKFQSHRPPAIAGRPSRDDALRRSSRWSPPLDSFAILDARLHFDPAAPGRIFCLFGLALPFLLRFSRF
ncbi:hypothetical protein BT93_G0853 [Corymbia citriodora subsp. variegata]|nr:hypothetical protein BT93_G0853 [Corymbia citriodora subsp. variegata]